MTRLLIAVLILVPFGLVKGEVPHDPYQDVAPDLVQQVDLARKSKIVRILARKTEAESLLLGVLKRKPDYYRALLPRPNLPREKRGR